jgi:hypothetical protein
MSPLRPVRNFSGGSGDGSDDPSGTGKQEGNACPVGGLPKEGKPKSCPQPSSEQGQADDSCNQRHDHTFLVRDQSTSKVECLNSGLRSVPPSRIPPVRCNSQVKQFPRAPLADGGYFAIRGGHGLLLDAGRISIGRNGSAAPKEQTEAGDRPDAFAHTASPPAGKRRIRPTRNDWHHWAAASQL